LRPKIGRPKADNPKDVDLKVRIDNETNLKLTRYSNNKKISKAQAVRNAIDLLLENEKE
jgi:hypothetical protein